MEREGQVSVLMECLLEPNGEAKSKFIQLKRERKENQQHRSMGGRSAHEAYISPSKVKAFANRPACVGGWVGGEKNDKPQQG